MHYTLLGANQSWLLRSMLMLICCHRGCCNEQGFPVNVRLAHVCLRAESECEKQYS